MFDWVFLDNDRLKDVIPVFPKNRMGVMEFVKHLPMTFGPEICGLNNKASLIYNQQKSKLVICFVIYLTISVWISLCSKTQATYSINCVRYSASESAEIR